MRLLLVPARVGGALLVLAAGGVHLYLYFDYFHKVHVVGVLFVLNAAAAVVIGLVLVISSRPLAAAAGAGFAAATLAFFFFSVYHGLFGFTERLRGGWQEAAGGIELTAVVILVPVLVAEVRGQLAKPANSPPNQALDLRGRPHSSRPGAAGVVVPQARPAPFLGDE